jgi:hypothetical protein
MAPVEAPIHYFAHLGGGKPIFGGSMERVIRWDTFADHAAQIVGYHTSPLLAIKASSKYVASVDQENKVKIWDEQGVAIDSFQLPGLFNAFCWVDSTQLTLAVDTNSTNSVLLSWKFGTDTLLPVAYRTQKHIYNIQKHPSKNLFALLESNQFASLINGEGKLIKQYNTLYSTDISMTEDALWTWSGSQLQAWDISDNPQAVYPLYEYTLPNYEPVMAVGSIQNRIMVCGLKSGPVYLPDHLKALKNNEIASLSPDMRAKFGLFPPVEEYIISNNIAELSDGIEIYYEMAGIATDTAEKILLSKQALQLCQRYSEFELLPLEYQQYVAAIHDEAMRSWINEQAVQYASDIQVFSLLAASLVSDTTLALDIHTALWNNSWALILAGAYSAGADMAKRAIDMNLPEPRRYTTITNQLMGQVLSGELTLTQAEAAYCQWMKVPWREDERFEYFGEIFQLDIDELRESGHLSPADKEKLDYMEAFLKAEKCK